MKFSQCIAILTLCGLAAGCSKKELILEGERYGVREALIGAEPGAEPLDPTEQAAIPGITLPQQVALADWPQVRGNAAHKVVHPALPASLTRVWSANIGSGDSRRHQITAEPVVAAGRIYTMDARSKVMAHDLAGKALWSADLTPLSEANKDATGGGLAYDEGRLFVTTGFGRLIALDAATGEEIWTQRTEATVTGAPAVADGLVYVVGRDDRAWAVRADNGRVQWQLPGTPSPSGMIGGAAPAVSGQTVIFPLASSELVSVLRQSGVRVWASVLSGQRRGYSYARISDITSDPVVDGNVLYAGSQSGRLAALDLASGEVLWTAEEGSYSPVWPSGGSVFLISDQNELLRLDAATGEKLWGVELPYFTKAKVKRRKAIFAHHGPVLAGGRLIVTSDDGMIRFFDPADGAALGSLDLPGGAASGPVVAGGTLYVVSARGQLHAFR